MRLFTRHDSRAELLANKAPVLVSKQPVVYLGSRSSPITTTADIADCYPID